MQITLSPQPARTTLLKFPQWIATLFTSQPAGLDGAEQRVTAIHALQYLARDVEQSQPNFAAELRHLAARN